MVKMVPATLDASGNVLVDGKPIEGAEKTGAGAAPSSGFVLIDGTRVVYVILNGSDLKTLIEKLAEITQQVATIATGLDGATNSPGAQASAIAQLTTMQGELATMKDVLQ